MKNYFLILFLCVISVSGYAQSKRITGKVTDASDGSPVIGVTIVALGANGNGAGKTVGTITGPDGTYAIDVPAGFTSLRFSYIGMETKTVKMNGQTQVNVTLSGTSEALGEVVVTALGVTREAKSLNYSRQSVNAESLAENNGGNLVASLSGKVAGVSITPPGTSNGSGRIVIRGTSSLTENSQPVFVIDGMIIENQPGDGGVTIDGGSGSPDLGNPVADINPDDIESIEILKGPNAAALYGSRAAQGVVLVTTKRADAFGKPKISYNGNFQFEKISQLLEYQNGWGTGENAYTLDHKLTLPPNGTRKTTDLPDFSGYNTSAGAKLRSWGAPLWDQVIYGHDGVLTTHSAHPENVSDFYDIAHRYTHTLSVEGGSKSNNYRVSYTRGNSNSVVHGINENHKDVFNLRLLNTILKGVTLDSKVTYSHEKVDNRQYMNGSDRNPVYAFVTLPRTLSIDVLKHYKDEAGNELIPIGERGYNPYWNIYENTNSDTRDRLNGSMNLEIQLLPGLKAVGKAGLDAYWWRGTEFFNLGARSDVDGGMKNWTNNSASTNFEALLMYNRNFGKISLQALAGISRYERKSEKQTQSVNSILVAGFRNISNSDEYPTVTQIKSHKLIRSAYASASLGYDNFLYVDVTARNDWSSTLPVNNCSYFYPSVGASFIFSELLHINPRILSFGKIRASFAYAGSDTEPYRISQTYALGSIYNGSPLQTINTTMNNPDLLPEQNRSLEVGADLRFLQNRLGIDVTYYRSDAYDLITKVALPVPSGYSYRYLNTGHIRNQGWEVVLSGTPVQTKTFEWNANINWSRNRSRVMKVVDGNPNVQLMKQSNVSIMLEEGMPYGVIRGRAWKRDEEGRKLVDASGKILVTDNTQYLGCAEPKWQGSLSSNFRWKNFTFSFLFDARIGGSLYSGTWNRATTAGVVAESMEGREGYFLSNIIYGESSSKLTGGYQYPDAYFEDGTRCLLHVKPNNRYASYDERSVFDASYIKFREFSVGYNVPKSFLKKLYVISHARLSVVGRNLAILYQETPKGIDPEASSQSGNAQGIEYGGMPPVASLGFDVKITF
ncbi:SusC/RagA family TonB-linked outer membrane protein [Parabacteroides pacaensis]|uniref:SusC/RagA family TonB-linked outer membrane protein n=1 Tax=Parabacteroides pacaensis TaxID=2086575 RepID=UPI000D0F1DA7|nr:SusC/RagA family TonB-linked outer membrane protein [Parabacteroides pacaensis]